SQRLALPRREAAVAQQLRIGREQLRGRGHVTSESLLQVPDDRAGRGDRKLLARDLEDERAEAVEGRQIVEPRPRTEVRPRVDQFLEDRIRVAEKLSRLRIGDRGSLARSAVDAHLRLPPFTLEPSRAYATRRSVRRGPGPRRCR